MGSAPIYIVNWAIYIVPDEEKSGDMMYSVQHWQAECKATNVVLILTKYMRIMDAYSNRVTPRHDRHVV